MGEDRPSGPGAVIHIVGTDVQVGSRRRQRCAWCGAILADEDLSMMGWQLNADGTDPGPPGLWPIGGLLAHDGAVWWIVDHEDGANLPPECCAELPDDLTSS